MPEQDERGKAPPSIVPAMWRVMPGYNDSRDVPAATSGTGIL